MKSSDYLYDILKKSPIDGYVIAGKRYCIGTMRVGGKWLYSVCRMRRDQVFSITPFFGTDEEAWVSFLSDNHPKILDLWVKLETAPPSSK